MNTGYFNHKTHVWHWNLAESPTCTFSGTELLISNTNIKVKQKPAMCKQNMLLFRSPQKISATSFNHCFSETWDFNISQGNRNSLSRVQPSPKEPQSRSPFSNHMRKQSGIIFSRYRTKYPWLTIIQTTATSCENYNWGWSLSVGSPSKLPRVTVFINKYSWPSFPKFKLRRTPH